MHCFIPAEGQYISQLTTLTVLYSLKVPQKPALELPNADIEDVLLQKVNYWRKCGQRTTQAVLHHNIFNFCAAGIYFSCSSAAAPGLQLPKAAEPKFPSV